MTGQRYSTNFEDSHDVSVSFDPETNESIIRFYQGEVSDGILHTLSTTGIVSHELIRLEHRPRK